MPMSAAEKSKFLARMAAGRAAASSTEMVLAPASSAITVSPARQSNITALGPPPRPAGKSLAKKLSSVAAIAHVEEKEALMVTAVGFGLGYAEQENYLQDLPDIDMLAMAGQMGKVAVYAYLANRYLIKDPTWKLWLSRITLAAGAAAGRDLGKGYAAKKQMESLTGKSAGEEDDDDGV